MRYWSVFLLLVVMSFNLMAQTRLSNEASISLLTCAAGDELYSVFGHSAIRVHDPKANLDVVFNYGTFDFDTPNFYLKFANGDLNYMLAYGPYNRFLRAYNYEKRSVWEQKLNLTDDEKQKLFDAIVTNAKPENKFYRYDFLFDNCATRIRDIIVANVDGEVEYNTSEHEEKTFRDMLHYYDARVPWIRDGLDIILGMKTDYDASQYDQMFLPDYLMKHLSEAKKVNTGTALLGPKQTILSFDKEDKAGTLTPGLLMWLLFFLSMGLVFVEVKRKAPFVVINRIVLLFSGVVGALIFFLWFLSRHSVTGENFNMLWAMPFNLFAAFLASWFYKSKVFKLYLLFLMVCVSIPLIFGWLIPQHLPYAIYPLCLLFISRYASWYFLLTRS
ncbi:DUF4105 domain-containing protein [Carboxylicivirga sp. M1479]|uniref:Lnb N-terminal periplasmic domain-containing protein n=1 Tax=Carboxylicivirga sp. M1479 TaxID=2594476 RepID=UPI0011785B0F|nr:DUF4105 domain-containing protein [Carboxylicivirga sp. M1479]TRX61160.1 DUF4105 domain-containing protein [Carboxylicivirga sp. M1479]